MHDFLDLRRIEYREFSLCLILECFGVLIVSVVKIISLGIRKTVKYERNSYMNLYALSRDLKISPLAGICAAQHTKSFIK